MCITKYIYIEMFLTKMTLFYTYMSALYVNNLCCVQCKLERHLCVHLHSIEQHRIVDLIVIMYCIVLCLITESLLGYFSQFGEIVDCVVMKNPETGKSRGFGFVTYKDPSCVETILSVTAHIVDGRQVSRHVSLKEEIFTRNGQMRKSIAPDQCIFPQSDLSAIP